MIEISKGSKVKYELDKKTGLIKVNEDDNWYNELDVEVVWVKVGQD